MLINSLLDYRGQQRIDYLLEQIENDWFISFFYDMILIFHNQIE